MSNLIFRRIVAHLIDYIIMGVFYLTVVFPNMIVIGGDSVYFAELFLPLFYYFMFEVIFDRTLGKLIMGLIVVYAVPGDYAERKMIRAVFIRTLCRIVPFDSISWLFNSNDTLWHDSWSNTRVIRRKDLNKN